MEEKKKTLEFVIGEIEGSFPQKFVIGARDGKLTYVAHELDGNIEYHTQIAAKFNVMPLGGGAVTSNGITVRFCDYSGEYGGVPEFLLRQFELEKAYKEKYGASSFSYDTCFIDTRSWKTFKR